MYFFAAGISCILCTGLMTGVILENFLTFIVLEIPASRVFLGANAQLLGTSLAGAKMP